MEHDNDDEMTITKIAKPKKPDTPYRPHACGSLVPVIREMSRVIVRLCVCVMYVCACSCVYMRA